jgi:hypothetical protein
VKRILRWIKSVWFPEKPEDIHCPVCGYYCLGRGGFGCIDKPTMCGYDLNKDAEIAELREDKARLDWCEKTYGHGMSRETLDMVRQVIQESEVGK